MWMKNATITGDRVVLVPYRRLHVLKYHEWMKQEELQYLTGSEPLTLDEEYQMQRSWATDEDKCTFIILDKNLYQTVGNEVDAMIGDTNVFLKRSEESEETIGEVEVMIALKSKRGHGLGSEITCLMIQYAHQVIGIGNFEVKIKCDNTKSIAMFRKLGFQEKSVSPVFNEITLVAPAGSSLLGEVAKRTAGLFKYEIASEPLIV